MKRAVDIIVRIQSFVAILFIVTFVFAVILQVATRYIPGFSWLWTEQIANYCFIWSIMLGASVGVRNKQHFSLSILTDRFEGKTALLNSMMVQCLIGFFGLFLSYYGTVLTKSFWNWSLTSLPQVRQGYFWMALPVCGVTMSIYAFYNAYEQFRDRDSETLSKVGSLSE
jgi:TRAP-type C4-dicarboxylate transport system permease small subunit